MSSPPVWSEFTKIRDGKELKFRIQELPEEKFGSLFELLYAHYVPEEPLHRAAGITDSQKSINEYKQMMQEATKKEDNHLDACYLVNDGKLELVGGSIMSLEQKAVSDLDWKEFYEMVQTKEMLKLLKGYEYMTNLCDVRVKYKLDKFYAGRGLCVAKDYRGLGLAEEIIKARVQVCRHYGVPMTGAWMSSTASQKAAANIGFETIYELKYDDLAKAVDLKFDSSTPPTCKLMVFKA